MNSHVTGSEIFPDIINLKNQKPIIDIFVYFVILCFLVFILYYYFFFQDIQRVTGTWECECDGVKFNWEINKVSWYNNKEINITPDKEIIQGIVIKGSVFKYAIGKFKAGFSKKIGEKSILFFNGGRGQSLAPKNANLDV